MPTPRNPLVAGIHAPSVAGRAVVAILLLLGFYVLTLGVAVVLIAIPPAALWAGLNNVRVILFAFALCWIPGFLLFASIFAVRRTPIAPSGRRLLPNEAPELFAIIETLAQQAGTAPPAEVYLQDEVTLAVTETTGPKTKRILLIGAPLLMWTSVEELRAGLAHEFGHFAFGDTRLLGIVAYVHAAFHGVFESTHRDAFADTGVGMIEVGFGFARAISRALVENYAKLFFWVTRRADRRAELAADRLAATLVGPDETIRLLEKFNVSGPLYDAYMRSEVGSAVAAGGVPVDLTAGFVEFSSRVEQRGVTAKLTEAVRSEKTDPFDAHPALAERVTALRTVRSRTTAVDSRLATSLLAIDLDGWLVERIVAAAKGESLARVRWADVPHTVYVPKANEDARAVAAKLFSAHPEAQTVTAMFAAVVKSLEAGNLERLAHHVAPELASVPLHQRGLVVNLVGRQVVTALFGGALLERGASIGVSLGDPGLVFDLDGTIVCPAELAAKSFDELPARQEVSRWATSLHASA